jgi:hypothetical protein
MPKEYSLVGVESRWHLLVCTDFKGTVHIYVSEVGYRIVDKVEAVGGRVGVGEDLHMVPVLSRPAAAIMKDVGIRSGI